MFGRWRTVLLVVVLALVAVSCRREDNTIPPVEQQDRIVQTAELIDDETLLVTWDPAPCETFEEVIVELDDDFANLRIRVTVDIDTCPPEGFTQATVELGEPLGDRKIWDRAFGNTVALEP